MLKKVLRIDYELLYYTQFQTKKLIEYIMQIKNCLNLKYLADCAALITGAILTLAFAPFSIFPIAILALTVLLALWVHVSASRAFFRGWLFGIGFFGFGVYWVFISIHTFGNLSIPIASMITSLFIGILALFPALVGYFLNRYFSYYSFIKICCAFPAIWVLSEWVRSWIFSGFPWLFLGYSQLNSPLRGYAPIFSVYGVSLAVALSATCLYIAIITVRQKKYKSFYFSLLALIAIWTIGSTLSFINWTKASGPRVKISLVQGNIPQQLKWSPDQVLPTLDHYQQLTEKHWDSRIVIWPESAIPILFQDATDFIDNLSNNANKHHSSIITGIPIAASQQGSYYNAVITLGGGEGVYLKKRLVPFGEFVPLTNLFKKFFDILKVPMSEFIPGPTNTLTPLLIDHIKIATFICYEIAFPEQVLTHDKDVGMILTVSNDAWFGRSIAQAQHLEIGQMRAIEMGRPVLFVSNNGITAFITPNGKIQSMAPQFESYVLTDSIQAYVGKTPWQYLGMDPILIILSFMVSISIYQQRRHKL